MNTVAIACRTIEDEVMFVTRMIHNQTPIVWIESGLHNFPEKLNKHIQEEIDKIESADYILLVFGYCGNSSLGLVSKNAKLVLPRVDDCISLLLGGNVPKNDLSGKSPAYFLTRGWLRYENNLWSEYLHSVKKYGIKRARRLMNEILKNYRTLNVIDTGAYAVNDFLWETKNIANEFGLLHDVVKGSMNLLLKAFQGEWDQDFLIVPPGQPIRFSPDNSAPHS